MGKRRGAWKPGLLLLALLVLPLAACGGGSLDESDRAQVAGRTFVVTGASSGLGRGAALRLGSLGGNVVLAARRAEALEEAAAQIRALGGQALAVPTDVSDPAQVDRLAQAALARFGRIDAWINNAGIGAIGRFEDIPPRDHARIVDVNLKGVIFGSHAALRQFRVQGFGTLVNVASVEGRIPVAYHASYAATKHAVIGLSGALRQELRLAGADRIQVATVLPWAVDTPYWDNTANYSGRTPRMAMMDDAQPVADAIAAAAVRPRKEIAVGWKAEGAVLGAQFWPGLAERIAGDVVHGAQMTSGPPAPPTEGAIFAPQPTPATVEGRTRSRMAREAAAPP
ncbi:SDR family NAD(P)-dependent oxidoreductase [Paracraurococcus ruber]|uniref:Short-chain dehydrogenase n=1 Tax=Paracraurococcus ruber TaxID=77675 RepID=A0ABS1CXE9_9PROT|nr:SDR family NAD(P)-dependent oxidoreductase [Paracraurococcus ruber]MBK1658981.1 short-chain dehydrogenase [Paracraurococcus ruber]TDG32604.1 SDR family NAD(P)-dependent oxidoreductase [Paracraurococcus ruber]